MPETASETVSEFLDRSRQEFHDDFELDRIDREEGESDNLFANSSDSSKSQWNPEAYAKRKAAFQPILQWNRIPTYINHVTNTGRQNNPEIKISAGDNGTDETANMLEARIRQILYDTKAEIVRDTMRDQQVTSGRAFGRITTEYIPGTKEQRICIDRIENEFSVVYGPGRKYDRSDSDRCWIITNISKTEYERRFGKASPQRTDFTTFASDWLRREKRREMVQIAEKFQKIYGEQDEETGERTWTVRRYVMNGVEILEEEEALTDDIGIVPQWGREKVVDDVQRHFSLINPAKDPQRLVNLYVSNIAEEIAAIPRDRWAAAIGSIAANHEDAYGSNSPYAIRWYKAWDEQGRQLPPPEPGSRDAPIQALTEGLMQSIDAIKAAMGIFDASMGERSNEVSGIAQKRRQVESEITNFHFQDNESRTWNRIGEILLKMIYKLDADKKAVPVRHYDGKTEMVPIGTPYLDKKTGKEVTHDLSGVADYGVHVEQGPSYQRAQEEAEEWQQGLITAAPELLMSGVGVSFLRNSGKPGADEQADALEALINFKMPGLLPKKDGPPLPPEVQAQMQQMSQKLQQTEAFAQSLHAQIQQKMPEIQQKQAEAQLQDATKRYTVDEQEKTKRTLGLATINSQEGQTQLEQELQIVHNKLDRTHELLMTLTQQQHERQQQQAQAAQATQSQVMDQQHQAQQSDADRQAAAEEPANA